MSRLTFLYGLGDVASRYGVDESIFLHVVVSLAMNNKDNDRNFRDGRWWTYNSLAAWEHEFSWWSAKQIRRIIASCKEQGAIIVGEYNKDPRDRTAWYSPSDELLAFYRESWTDKCKRPDGQMRAPERAAERAQTGTTIPKESQNKSTKITSLRQEEGDDFFRVFWDAYPKKIDKRRSYEVFKRLKVTPALLAAMLQALEAQKRSEQWQKAKGQYIPHASTWLNGRRWEDETQSGCAAPPPAAGPLPAAAPPRARRTEIINGEEVVIYGEPVP